MADIKDIQKKLRQNKNFAKYTIDELKYVQKPIGRALYKIEDIPKCGRPRVSEKKSPSDRIICNICSKEFTRSGRTKHNRTQYHQAFEEMNSKLRKLLIDKE